MKLLIVEDEPKVGQFLQKGLQESGFEADLVYDGEMGKKYALRNTYDAIILDVIVPMINGIELCKQIREEKPNVPILMLTALGTTEDKITGFDAGADDYLLKPFEFVELLARIKALVKRGTNTIETSNKLKIADLELDLNKKVAERGGKTIELTSKEFNLLEYFMRNKGRVLSRSQINEKVWELDFDTGTNVIDVYVNILRKKIDKDFDKKLIQTKVGMGYIFAE
jgi:two-component system copper resistance phosphate regulon response regulator CusR